MSIGDARRCASRLGGIAGDGDVDEIDMVRETEMVMDRKTEMVREIRGDGDI